MQIENDYDKEVYNGDIGYIEDVDLATGELAVDFDGRYSVNLIRSFPPMPRPSTRANEASPQTNKLYRMPLT
jgi:ATP-dependent exoDNAse (exonuclease V) alpha subunit